MAIQYWITDNGNGDYCHGDATNVVNALFVTERPDDSIYNWNTETEEWETTLELKKTWIRYFRNAELLRTDKFILPDYYAEFTEEQQGEITTYRQALRDVPDHETIEEIVMPDCPEFMN